MKDKYHKLINDTILVNTAYLKMLLNKIQGNDMGVKGVFNDTFINSLNKNYIKECSLAFEKYSKQLDVLIKKWYKVTLESNPDNGYEDYSEEDIEKVYTSILSLYKQNMDYVLSKLNTDYDTFKGIIKNPRGAGRKALSDKRSKQITISISPDMIEYCNKEKEKLNMASIGEYIRYLIKQEQNKKQK